MMFLMAITSGLQTSPMNLSDDNNSIKNQDRSCEFSWLSRFSRVDRRVVAVVCGAVMLSVVSQC